MDGAYSAPHWSEASEGPCFSAITAGFATSRRRSRANLLSEAELAILARPVRSLFEGAIDESPRLDLVSRLCHPIDQRWCHGAGADGPSSEADRCDCSRLYLPALAGADPGRTNRLHVCQSGLSSTRAQSRPSQARRDYGEIGRATCRERV